MLFGPLRRCRSCGFCPWDICVEDWSSTVVVLAPLDLIGGRGVRHALSSHGTRGIRGGL